MDPGSHAGFQFSTKNTNLVEDHTMNIAVVFAINTGMIGFSYVLS
jgi:hypothetical protein